MPPIRAERSAAGDQADGDLPRSLYLASTPMIALLCAAAARAQGGRARLVLIEDFDLAARFAGLLQGWRDTPFEQVVRLPGRYTEHQRGAPDRARGVAAFFRRIRIKRGLRQDTLATLRALDADFAPDTVWVGNDRKVETQYALHLASSRMRTAVGRYLDDGLYTYLGDVRQRPLVRRIDWLVKQLTYGTWWQRAEQVGTTSWIGQAWLTYPHLAPTAYAGTQQHALPREWLANRAFLRLSARAAHLFEVPRKRLRGCGGVLVLPHSNQLRAEPEAVERLRAYLRAARAAGAPLALKYHPRETQNDPAGLFDAETLALPALLPMELLLPLLPRGALLVGEGSTALLAAHWLRPDLQVHDLGLSQEDYAQRARALFARAGLTGVGGGD